MGSNLQLWVWSSDYAGDVGHSLILFSPVFVQTCTSVETKPFWVRVRPTKFPLNKPLEIISHITTTNMQGYVTSQIQLEATFEVLKKLIAHCIASANYSLWSA